MTREPPTTEGESRAQARPGGHRRRPDPGGPPPSAANATDVCNEAENSWQGDYDDRPRPAIRSPPAFLRGEQMVLGNGNGKGLGRTRPSAPRRWRSAAGDGDGGDGGGPVTPTCETNAAHVRALRCVFYDPDAVDAGTRLSERAFEACARADVEVFALAGDEDAGRARRRAPRRHRRRRRDRVRDARARRSRASSASASAPALPARPLGAVWVGPLDLDVRGPHVRVAEEGDELLYEAVISELAARRRG